jgi:hypothetical protein
MQPTAFLLNDHFFPTEIINLAISPTFAHDVVKKGHTLKPKSSKYDGIFQKYFIILG